VTHSRTPTQVPTHVDKDALIYPNDRVAVFLVAIPLLSSSRMACRLMRMPLSKQVLCSMTHGFRGQNAAAVAAAVTTRKSTSVTHFLGSARWPRSPVPQLAHGAHSSPVNSTTNGTQQGTAAGALKHEITFTVIDPDAAPGEYESADYPSPYISLAHPAADLAHLQHPDEVVIHAPSIRVVADYPLGGTFEFDVLPGDGRSEFTRAALARAISDLYQRIYKEEEETAGGPTPCIPGMYNRGFSKGKYGIWGHYLEDLLLTDVYTRGDGKYYLGIDS
jgi:hypothetical protein